VLPTFRPDGSINVIVESPRGAASKFKYDPETDRLVLSRPLPAGLTYPYDWGFVSATRAPDGDPLDAMIVWDGHSYPGIVIPCHAIGVLRLEQTNLESKRRERNDRLVVRPVKAPRRIGALDTVFDLSERERLELEQFFRAATAFEGKDVQLRDWGGPDEADRLLRASLIEIARGE
jgi:inorganic pyrophosphatase